MSIPMPPHPAIRRVVVTGASGIAAATARRLAARRDSVFVISRNPAKCAALIGELGPSGAGWHAGDLALEPDAVAAFEAAAHALGAIDGVVAVAGGSARKFGDGWLHEMTLDAWNVSLSTNLTTMFLTAREAVRHMRSAGGSLVMTSSVLATSPQRDTFTTHGYAAAKAAITGWAVPLAAAYAADGIRVNVVAPGLVRTPMARRAAEDDEILAFARRKQPLAADMLSPDVVAKAMIFMLDAEGVTGQVIAVDGGWMVTSTS
jgi:NAD(P)-dependent dehydrogenase (short-subunit alcohol dehydrogenase family)